MSFRPSLKSGESWRWVVATAERNRKECGEGKKTHQKHYWQSFPWHIHGSIPAAGQTGWHLHCPISCKKRMILLVISLRLYRSKGGKEIGGSLQAGHTSLLSSQITLLIPQKTQHPEHCSGDEALLS